MEELLLERIDVYRHASCSETIFAMKNLKLVRFPNTLLGYHIVFKLKTHKQVWTHFSGVSMIWGFPLENLLKLGSLINLDLTNISSFKIVNFIANNLSSFKSLQRINLTGNYQTERIVFSDALASQGIKMELDYDFLDLTILNWENYCAISTGLPINFNHNSNVAVLLISKARQNDKYFEHITDLSIGIVILSMIGKG